MTIRENLNRGVTNLLYAEVVIGDSDKVGGGGEVAKGGWYD